MKVRGSVPSLIQGISQQVPTLRPPGYIEDGLNVYGTIIEGLGRRPPSEFVTLMPGLVNPSAYHSIVRDDAERHFVAADEGVLKVFDFEGTAKTVAHPDGWTYISGASSLGFLTVNDYTYVYDRGKTVAMSAEVETGSTPEGMFFIRQGDYGTTYKIEVGYPAGAPSFTSASLTTSTTDATLIKIDYIAATLATTLATNLGGGYTVTQVGHIIHVKRVDNANFVIQASDSATGKNVIAIKDRVNKFSDLSTIGKNDFHIRISGDEASTKDDWFAKFVTTNPSGGIGPGYWRECPEPGALISFDAATMPHVLVSEADGTFTFRKADWGKRASGAPANSPAPSIVGKKINGMGAAKGRLEFFAEQSYVTSRAADLFHLWPISAQLQSDVDPIDVSPSYPKPYILRGSAEFAKGLILYANNVQFLATSGDVFGPKTIATKPLTTFDLEPTKGLLGLQGDRVVCTLKRKNHIGLMAWKTPSQSVSEIITDEASAVVPALIPGVTEWIAGTTSENAIVVKASGSPNLYVYKEAMDAGRTIQSAWTPWYFKNRTPVAGFFDGPDLHVLLKDSANTFALEKLSLRALPSQELSWEIYLDRRTTIEAEDCVASGATTTVTLPWTARTGEVVLMVITEGPQAGAVAKAISTGTNSATFPGLFETGAVVGVVANAWAEPSTFYWRKPVANGGEEAVTEGVLQVLRGKVSYADSGPFTIRIKPKDRPDEQVERVATPLFEDGGFEGPQDLSTGSQDFPIGAINDRVSIRFDSGESPMPMKIASLEWSGDLNIRAKPL